MIALVAGATRGAGRGIAVALGEAGATVHCTGRSTREQRSEVDRPETIEPARPPAREHDLANGLRLLRLALDTHLITLHHLLPRLRPGGLVVEMTDGTAAYNAEHYRVNLFYDLAKTGVTRLAWGLAHELEDRTAVALTPGWLRSEAMLEHHGVSEANWRDSPVPHFCISESPLFVGRAVAALSADPDVRRWHGQSLSSGQLAQVYGFTDTDGTRPDCWRYLVQVQEPGAPADDTGYR